MKKRIQLIASVFCFALGANALYAASGTWINNATSGDWGNSANWVAGAIADGAGFFADTPQLSGGTRYINLDTDRTIGFVNLRPNESGVSNRVWVVNGPGILTLSDPGNPPTTSSGPRINVRDGISVVNAVIAGNEGAGFCNLGILFLRGTNTYSGDTLVYRERVQIGNVDALPHGSRTGNITLMMGGNPGDFAKLDLQDFDITINGLNSATNSANSQPQVSTWSVTAGTSTLSLGDNNANGIFDGDIVDGVNGRAMALTKIGTGTQTLAGNSTYSGATTVNAGGLFINGSIGGGFPASTVSVNGGAIGGSGTINGPVYIYAGGGISPGASAGTLTLYDNLDMSAPNTTYNWELAANSTTPGDFDTIALLIGSADVTDANLNIQFIGSATAPNGSGFWASDHSWLIVSGAVTGNFKNIQNGTNSYGYFYTTVSGSGVTLNFKYAPSAPRPHITSITGAGTASVTVNYNNCVVSKTYYLQWKSPVTGVGGWTTIGSGKVAAGTSDSQTDSTAGGSQRYYRLYYVAP